MKKPLIAFFMLFAVMPTYAQAPIAPTYFGMIMEFPTTTAWPKFFFGRARLWDNLESGVETNWTDIETSLNIYNFNHLDAIVAQYQSHGIISLAYTFSYGYGTNWQNGGGVFPTGGAPPSDISTIPGTNCGISLVTPCYGSAIFSNFINTLVTRYKGKISAYGCWNEADTVDYWSGTQAQLVAMCSNVYTLVHSIDPAAIVLSPSTSAQPSGVPWMQSYLAAASAGPYYDRFNIHCYPWNAAVAPEFFANEIAYNYYAVLSNGLTATIQCDEFDSSIIPVTPLYVAVSYILGWPNNLLNLSWYQFDNASFGNLVGTNQGLNAAGAAYRIVNNWLFEATWTSLPTRQVNANGIRNITFSGAVAGTPGTAPTNMTASSSNGGVVSSIASVSTGQVCWSIVGTPTGNGNAQFQFETNGIIAATVGQSWTFSTGISLSAGSLTNVQILIGYGEYNAGSANLTTDFPHPAFFPISGLAASTQLYWSTGTLTQATVASVVPLIFIPYTTGNPVNLTLCFGGTPSMDNGSKWVGNLTRVNGANSVIAWDAANGANGTISFTTAGACGGSTCGVWRDIAGQSHAAGSTVPLTNSPVIFDVVSQAVGFN